jgi:hypothetical protein
MFATGRWNGSTFSAFSLRPPEDKITWPAAFPLRRASS